jgi:hypothetical protein
MLIRKLLRRGLLGVVMAVVSSHPACAQDRPDHKNALAQIMSQLSDPSYSITRLQYANGFEKDQNNYIVFTTYTRVFKVSSSTFAKSISDSDNPLVRWAQSVVVSSVYGHFEPGDSFDESAKFRFLRTENGWILQGYEGDAEVVNRHTEIADALDEQKKRLDEQSAQEVKVHDQKMAVQEQKNAEHLTEVHNACASRQEVRVRGEERVGFIDEHDNSTWDGPAPGQVVLCDAPFEMVNAPGVHNYRNDSQCHVRYSNGKQVVTGYVFCQFLFVIEQPQGMVTGDPSAQKMEKIPVADALPTWTHSATGLMWAKVDNGSDVNWSQANAYCANLQLGGYSGWRLATIDELQGIYDPGIDIPGQCCNGTAISWHVKGNLHLSGAHWSNSQGNASGEASGFSFVNGKRFSNRLGNSFFKRALCVRRSGE